MDLNSIQNMAEWNLELYLIEMRRIHLNHISYSRIKCWNEFVFYEW